LISELEICANIEVAGGHYNRFVAAAIWLRASHFLAGRAGDADLMALCIFSCFFVFVFEIGLVNPAAEEAAKGPKGRKGLKRGMTGVGASVVFICVQ